MTKQHEVREQQPSDLEQAAENAMLDGSMAAMRRAALRARQIAEQTGTDLIVMRDGKIVHIPPEQIFADRR